MPRSLSSPDRLFDRTWRPGHPFGPRLSRLRRFGMLTSFILLSAIIGGYWYVTDSNRVRNMAMSYLSELIGGRVTIGEATLSIFQGLRLNDVRIYTSAAKPRAGHERDPESDESLLFRAQSFLVRADPRALLSGNLEATQIVAVDPYVRLTEDLSTGLWEHQKLHGRLSAPSKPKSANDEKPPRLPELILRNAQVEYGQIDHGTRSTRGTIALEGQLSPGLEPDVYLFKLQSRGASEAIGPSVDGRIMMSSGTVSASLSNFRFGADLEAMLPAQVRKWWKDHALAGRVDVPELTYRPPPPGSSTGMRYRAEIDVRGVGLAIQPDELLGPDETQRQRWSTEALDAMRAVGLDAAGFVSELHQAITPTPIVMHQVTGKFVFTEEKVEVRDVSGYVESNGLSINGHIDNYAEPEKATAAIRVASLRGEDIAIPAAPRYMNSMPLVVQEIYDHLRPQGKCSFWIDVKRDAPHGRPIIDGEINVLGGQFIFDEFPYPIYNATGRLVIGRNKETGAEQLEILDILGHGVPKGPNENGRVKISGLVSPFGEETGVKIAVVGDGIVADPLVIHSLPRETQIALRMFDADGQGNFPKFKGGFRCDVERPKGRNQHWKFQTAIHFDDAAGKLVVFPYPMENVSGDLTVLDDRVEIKNTTMKKNGATLAIDGDVSWKDPHERKLSPDEEDALDDARADLDPNTGRARHHRRVAATTTSSEIDTATAEAIPTLRTNLRVVATNVPIDEPLINALPADQRGWLRKSGVTGRFDLDGDITPPAPTTQPNGSMAITSSEPTFDFHITLKGGAMWPIANQFAATALNGEMRLSPGRVIVEWMTGKRGSADLSLHGNVDWSDGPARAAMVADATNLTLDKTLYDLLPAEAQEGWNAVRPVGSLDASVNYSGIVDQGDGSTTKPADAASFEVTMRPRQLSVTPLAVPYQLDHVTGVVVARPDRVTIQDVTGQHGNSKVRLAGTGTLGQRQSWDFKLSADDVPMDDAFSKAAPPALADLIKSTQMRGNVGFTFDKLVVVTGSNATPATQPTTAPSVARSPADDNVDVDFAVRLNAAKAAIDVGVPLSDATGAASFAGSVRGGKMTELNGAIDFASLTLAGKPATNLRATLAKPAGQDFFRVGKLETRIADGELAGQFDCALGDNGPTRYATAMVLRNADVTQLTGEAAPDFRGRLSASLALEGAFNDAASRRGRGDVNVSGNSMYRIPLLLGLLQITNLALPITSPFNEATSRYSVDGNRVAFESIELRAKDMMMQGSGHLDFATKEVRLTFTTDNTTWPKLPIIGDLIQGARHELLQINVKGTLQEPKVSAGAFTTFTTTVDEVFKGNDKGDAYSKKKK